MSTTRGGAETSRNFFRVSPPLGFCTAATTAGVARINALVDDNVARHARHGHACRCMHACWPSATAAISAMMMRQCFAVLGS